MLLQRHRLARQEASPVRVLAIPNVHRCDVSKLVIGQREETLAGGERLHRQRQRRDVEQHRIIGGGARGGVAVIAEILEQDGGPVPRFPVEFLFVEGERIFDRPGNIGRQIGLDRVEIEQAEILGLERAEVDPRCVGRDVLGPLGFIFLGIVGRRGWRRGIGRGDRFGHRCRGGSWRRRRGRLLGERGCGRTARQQRGHGPPDDDLAIKPPYPRHRPPFSA